MKWLYFFLSVCLCTSCDCGKDWEHFLFGKMKILYGHCEFNGTKYEDAQIDDPQWHTTDPYHTTQEPCYFPSDTDIGFVYRLLSLPGTELPEVKYHLYFFLPQPNIWEDVHQYKIDSGVSYSYKIPTDLDQTEIDRFLSDYKPSSPYGGAVLYDKVSGEEIDLVGDLRMVRKDDPKFELYTFSYSLRGKNKDGISMTLRGKFRGHKYTYQIKSDS